MDDQDAAEFETTTSTPPVTVSNSESMLHSDSRPRKNCSDVWDHFTRHPGPVKKAKCNYCGTLIKHDNGTSSMRSHTGRCKMHPDREVYKRQKSSSSTSTVNVSPSVVRFDQEKGREELLRYFVAMEIPFRHVEHPAFKRFVNFLQPRFGAPSRTTVARDVFKQFEIEKASLKTFLYQHCQRACLTTDMWTSTQKFSFMCLTVHFVDNNWVLQKRILNYCQVESHSGEVMAKTVHHCLNDWGLQRILSLTVDNATSNDKGISILTKRLKSTDRLVLNGNYIHMRCLAHVLNLIVKDGLGNIGISVSRIREAIRYVRASYLRHNAFKECVQKVNVEYKGLAFLDCEIRWNSTYLMLKSALKLRKGFDEFEIMDRNYLDVLQKGYGVPTIDDWNYVELILPFLEVFYRVTVRISGTTYVTSNTYMYEMFGIGKKIKEMGESMNASVRLMAGSMKAKYHKYFNPESLNMLLLIALVLDPRRKLKFVNWLINEAFDGVAATTLKHKLESSLTSIFEEYSGGVEGAGWNSQDSRFSAGDDEYGFSQYYTSSGSGCDISELSKYLEERSEGPVDLDILNWWKINASRLPILASIARDVLAIPVTTVASESAFSTGGRVLDEYRASLTPKMVEALICIQDWTKGESTSILEDDFEVVEKCEQEFFSQRDVAPTFSLDLDD